MKKFHKSKLNNNGSTTVFVIVALMFIGLLAALILALSAASFKMRNLDYQSRKNFYEGEEFSGKIYSEIGMNAMGILGEAYVTTMGQMNAGSITGETALNDYIKKVYYRNMLIYLHLIPANTKVEDVLPEYTFTSGDAKVSGAKDPLNPSTDSIQVMLQDMADSTATKVKVYIDNAADATDDGNIKVTCKLEGGVTSDGDKYPVITIHDVHLQYIDDTNKLESNYTFDVVITYPDWEFTYANPVSASIDIDTFLDYVVISNDYIKFDDVTSEVYGCISTGNNFMVADNSKDRGLIIDRADVHFYENADNRYEKMAIVTTDNILLNGTAVNGSSMYVHGGTAGDAVWCNSIVLDREPTNNLMVTNGSVFTSSNAKLYVQDDIQLDGEFSSVSVSDGVYYGYSANKDTNSSIAHNSSSSIIVNGNNSKLNLKDIDRMVVNGLAYLNFGDANYRTGESLAVKGNQDAYLVPNSYMGGTQSNPVRSGVSVNPDEIKKALVGSTSTFFGKDYLDQEEPYVIREYTINGREYAFFYLNFNTYQDERDYVFEVLNTEAGTDTVKKDIQDRIMKNLAEMKGDTSEILNVDGITEGFTAGAIVTAKGGLMLGSASASNIATINIDVDSMHNRYLLMKSLLLPVCGGNAMDSEPTLAGLTAFEAVACEDIEYKRANPSKFTEADYGAMTDNTRAIVNTYLNRSAFDNFVNLNKLELYAGSAEKGIWQREHSTSEGTGLITYATWVGENGSANGVSVTDEVVYIDSGYKGVLVTNLPVVIEGSVEGLVFSAKGVTVSGDGTLKSNAELVDELMRREQNVAVDACHNTMADSERRSDVLKFYPIKYQGADDKGETIDQLTYSDIIYIDNWRKYNDERYYSGVVGP